MRALEGLMRMKVLGLVVLGVCLAASARVMTVTNGQPDGNRHPYAGVVIQFSPDMPGFVTVCSGSALSSTKFLTAAHCADPSRPVFVSYKSGPPFSLSKDFTPGTFHPNPNWCIACGPGLPGFDTHDVAVVTLGKPVNPGDFATLPAAGVVDTLPMGTFVDIVGYGVQGFIPGGGRKQQVFLFTRYFAPSQLIQSNNVASVEVDAARFCADLKAPHPHLAIEALTGQGEVWWLNGFESEAEKQRVYDAYANNRPLMAALAGIGKRRQDVIATDVDIFASYRADLSRGAPWTIAGARFFVVTVTKDADRIDGPVFEPPAGGGGHRPGALLDADRSCSQSHAHCAGRHQGRD